MRKLASIKQIAEVKSIPDADKICAYRVDGWWVVGDGRLFGSFGWLFGCGWL